MTSFTSLRTAVFLAVAAAALATSAARADFALQLSEVGGPSQTISDNGAGDLVSQNGAIAFYGTVGDFVIQSSSSLTDTPGGHINSQLTLATNTIRNNDLNNAHTLTLTASATGYTAPASPLSGITSIGGTFGLFNALTDKISMTSYVNPDNVLFSTSGYVLGSLSSTRADGTSFNENTTLGGITYSGAYSVTTVVTLTLGANMVDSDGRLVNGAGFDARTELDGAVAAPAPAGLILALTAFPVLGGFGFFRRKKS